MYGFLKPIYLGNKNDLDHTAKLADGKMQSAAFLLTNLGTSNFQSKTKNYFWNAILSYFHDVLSMF